MRKILRKVLVVFDDMIVDMEPNKTLSPIVTELLLKQKKKLTIPLVLYHYLISKCLKL